MPHGLVGEKVRKIPSLSGSQELLWGQSPPFLAHLELAMKTSEGEGTKDHLPQEGW